MTSVRIWIISELYYPEETSTGHSLTQLAEGLVARGHKVCVLCGQPRYIAREQNLPNFAIHRGVEINRTWSTRLDKDILWKRLLNLLTITSSLFLSSLRRLRRGDCVLVVTNPPVLPFFTALVCRLKCVPCLLMVQDVYPEFAIAAGVLKPHSLISRLWGALMRLLCQKVDRISVLGRDMQEIIRRKRGKNPQDVRVITNWADLHEIAPTPRNDNPLLRQLGLVDKFVVQNAGNMGPVHDVELLARAGQLLADLPQLHFLVIGSGSRMALLKKLVKEFGLTNFTILPSMPRQQSPVFLNACDVALSIFVPQMYGVSVPSRIYNILAAGKPILAVTDAGSELARLIEEEQIGWTVPPNDVNQFAQRLREAYAQQEKLPELGKRARAAAEEKYSLDLIVKDTEDLIADMTNPDSRSEPYTGK
jgi:colanic acid biosynthesis glycosyl transferase WcaI